MRENESDSGDGRPGPYDYISPWAARDPGEAGQAPAAGADLPRDSDRQDTIAFGEPWAARPTRVQTCSAATATRGTAASGMNPGTGVTRTRAADTAPAAAGPAPAAAGTAPAAAGTARGGRWRVRLRQRRVRLRQRRVRFGRRRVGSRSAAAARTAPQASPGLPDRRRARGRHRRRADRRLRRPGSEPVGECLRQRHPVAASTTRRAAGRRRRWTRRRSSGRSSRAWWTSPPRSSTPARRPKAPG